MHRHRLLNTFDGFNKTIFPTSLHTDFDFTQQTLLRVDRPKSDCGLQPDGANPLFEVPIAAPLPEVLNFLP